MGLASPTITHIKPMQLTNEISIIRDLCDVLNHELTEHPNSGKLNRAYSLVVAISTQLEKLEIQVNKTLPD
jgi:hypothetical protein